MNAPKAISAPAQSQAAYERARNRVDALERFRLGEAIMDSRGWTAGELVATFSENDFQSSLHRVVFRAIKALIGRGAVDLDVGLVVAELENMGVFAEFVNAIAYVCTLTEGVVPISSRASRAFRLNELRDAWAALRTAKKAVTYGD